MGAPLSLSFPGKLFLWREENRGTQTNPQRKDENQQQTQFTGDIQCGIYEKNRLLQQFDVIYSRQEKQKQITRTHLWTLLASSFFRFECNSFQYVDTRLTLVNCWVYPRTFSTFHSQISFPQLPVNNFSCYASESGTQEYTHDDQQKSTSVRWVTRKHIVGVCISVKHLEGNIIGEGYNGDKASLRIHAATI